MYLSAQEEQLEDLNIPTEVFKHSTMDLFLHESINALKVSHTPNFNSVANECKTTILF